MKQPEKPLRHLALLARGDVAEVALAAGRLPCVKIGGAFKPIDQAAMTNEAIFQILFAAGGSRHVDNLGQTPVNWQFRLDGVGLVAVGAMDRQGSVQARFVVSKRDPVAAAPAAGELDVTALRNAHAQPGLARTPSDAFQPAVVDRPRGFAPSSIPPQRVPSAPPTRAPSARPDAGYGTFDDLELDGGASGVPQAPGVLAYTLDFNGRVGPESAGGAAPASQTAAGQNIFDGSLESLMRLARQERASDMHVVAERPLLLRIAGELLPRGEALESRLVETMLLQIVPARLAEGFQRDGSVDFALEHWKFGRFRVNVTRQRTGLKGCFRLIGEEVPTLEGLHLPDAIGAATKHHQGLIVVTGPTGHGKTTTLSAIVDLINRETTHHVITIEDPVEIIHPRKRAMMSQREVGTHTQSFRSALKGSLREDPDVIVIGELRDTETVRIALAASETGHLVIGTMNTPSAAKTIDRLIDLFPASDQAQVRMTLAGGLKLVVSQRLVPNAQRNGMHAACEVLPGSVALWNLIRENKTFQIPSLQQRGKALGIIRLDESLAELVKSQRSTLDIVRSYAEAPAELDAFIAGRPLVQMPAHLASPPGAKKPSGQMPVSPGKKEEKGLFGIFGKKG